MSYIDPDRDAWAIFKGLPKDAPIQMLNLVKLKPLADYPADHPDHGKGLTGLDAYRAYGRTTAQIFAGVGGRQVWVGKPQVMVTGPQAEAWDLAFIAQYPSADAFIAMVRDPAYREHVKHRTAGVADSRLLCLSPAEPARVLENRWQKTREVRHSRQRVPVQQAPHPHRSSPMLALRPNCECCDRDLAPDSPEARICTFECTFCADCVETRLGGACPNCGGDFAVRPIRPVALLAKYPASTERVVGQHKACAA